MSNRIFILDTCILLHDPYATVKFDDNTVVIPMCVLEELDHIKDRKTDLSKDARMAIRMIESIIQSANDEELVNGNIPINRTHPNMPESASLIVYPDHMCDFSDNRLFMPEGGNADNRLVNVALKFQDKHAHNPAIEVVLVTKDINLRLKAKCAGVRHVEDYSSTNSIKDVDLLHTGFTEIEGDFWQLYADSDEVHCHKTGNRSSVRVPIIPEIEHMVINDYLFDNSGVMLRVTAKDDKNMFFEDITVAKAQKRKAWKIMPKDMYQAMAMNSLMDKDIDLTVLLGPAGSGKTLITLACALELTLEKRQYDRIIFSRTLQSQFEEIGFLPGNEHEKISPWAGAAFDALEFMHREDANPQKSIEHLIMDRQIIQFKALNFIRGRSFQNTILIIDEAQNLTSTQMKTIITRAGQNCKVILMGNLAQIDNQYVSPTSSGLTYVTERFKGEEVCSIIQLQGIVRSRLADLAEKKL